MNKKINTYIIITFTLFTMISCTCVPSIDTEKVVTPSDLAHILFIHAQPDYEAIKVITDDGVLYKNISYQGQGTDDSFSYKDVKTGTSIITITNFQDSSILFKSQLYLLKDVNYSFITFGKGTKFDNLLLMDSISNYSSNNAYVRFLNLSPDSPTCNFNLKDDYNQTSEFLIPNGSYSQFYPVHIGKFSLIINDSLNNTGIYKIDSKLQFDAGMKYTLLFRGYIYQDSINEHKYTKSCMIIKTK